MVLMSGLLSNIPTSQNQTVLLQYLKSADVFRTFKEDTLNADKSHNSVISPWSNIRL